MRRTIWSPAWLLLALGAVLPDLGSSGGLAAAPARPATPSRSTAASEPAAPASPAEADSPIIADFGRIFGTWLWLSTEGIVADSNPETKGAYRRLVLKPDLAYEFHQRRATRDTVLCQGRYTFTEETSPDGSATDIIEFDGWYETYEKRMIADFDAPDTLRLLGYPCENCPDHVFVRGEAATIKGEVERGQGFRLDLWGGMRFELVPVALGWEIAVRDTTRPDEDLARLTPPFHFVPNPRDIEGSQFRNAAHPGPTEGGMYSPEEGREFIFSREVGRSIQGPDAGHAPTEEEIERVGEEGRGVLTIEELKLDEPKVGEQAAIGRMKFTVAIEEVMPSVR